MSIQYSLFKTADDSFITVVIPGEHPLSAASAHPNFDEIVALVVDDESDALAVETDENDIDIEYLVGLFDLSAAVARKFKNLSERVTVAHGTIFFDGDEVETPLTKQIARFLSEGVDDWKPLVAFFEKVEQNANPHSREQLYNWLDKHDFTIDSEGDIVGYKGVTTETGEDGEEQFVSVHSGRAIVDGVVVEGRIPNKPGSVITMPREQVQHDPSQGCHRGLHVGTYSYASTFGSRLLEVKVNPRDVVSVPTDCSWQKVRCCRYEVVDTLDSQYTGPIKPLDVDGSDDDDDQYFVTINLDIEFPA